MCLEGWVALLQSTALPSWSILLLRSSWRIASRLWIEIDSPPLSLAISKWRIPKGSWTGGERSKGPKGAKDNTSSPSACHQVHPFNSPVLLTHDHWPIILIWNVDAHTMVIEYSTWFLIFNALHTRGDEELDALIKATISGGGVGQPSM